MYISEEKLNDLIMKWRGYSQCPFILSVFITALLIYGTT